MPIAVVAADGDLLEQVLDETYPVWGEGLDRHAYAKYNRSQRATTWGSARLQRIALVEDGRLLASAKRYDLDGLVDGRRMKLLGVGAVFTPPALRGRGHAAELLRRMLESAAEADFGAALLFSEIDPRYYERHGFREVPINQVSFTVRPGRRAGTPAIPIRSGDFGDLKAIGEMNAMQSEGFRFALARDADYTRHAITKKRLLAACGTPGHRQVEFLVVEEGGRAAAYMVLLEVGEFIMVSECGDRDPSGARVGAMLQAVAARDSLRPIRWRAWLPPGFVPPQVEIVAHEIPPVTMMMRPLGRSVWPSPPLTAHDIVWWHSDAF